jgi:hypothetical protein
MEQNISYTQRGFKILKFLDLRGTECSIQESSSAEIDALWIGADCNRMLIDRKSLFSILREFKK